MINSLPIQDFSEYKNWLKINNSKNYDFDNWGNSGAEAIAIICKEEFLKKRRKINLLLPGYFCGQTLKFLRTLDVNFYFYKLNDDLTPDLDYIQNNYNSKIIDLFIAVHYFGKLNNFEEINYFFKDKNVEIIEDCAHIISPNVNHTFVGDFLIFCPHKFYPLPQISLIRRMQNLNKTKLSKRFPLIWFLKQFVKRLNLIKKKNVWKIEISSFKKLLSDKYPSLFLVNAAKNYLDNYKIYSKIRIRNYSMILDQLKKIEFWEPMYKLEKCETPFLLPMLCKTDKIAKKRFNMLNKEKVLVMQWPDISQELIQENSIATKECLDKVQRTIFFFTHQKLDIKKYITEIKNISKQKNF